MQKLLPPNAQTTACDFLSRQNGRQNPCKSVEDLEELERC